MSKTYQIVNFDGMSPRVQLKHIIDIGSGRNLPKNGLGTHLGGGNPQLLCLELVSTMVNQVGNRSGVLRTNAHGFVLQIVRSAPNSARQRVGIALGRRYNIFPLCSAHTLANINTVIIEVVNAASVNNQFSQGGDKFELFVAAMSMSVCTIINIDCAVETNVVMEKKYISNQWHKRHAL